MTAHLEEKERAEYEEKFKRINAAYEIHSDEDKRKQYDGITTTEVDFDDLAAQFFDGDDIIFDFTDFLEFLRQQFQEDSEQQPAQSKAAPANNDGGSAKSSSASDSESSDEESEALSDLSSSDSDSSEFEDDEAEALVGFLGGDSDSDDSSYDQQELLALLQEYYFKTLFVQQLLNDNSDAPENEKTRALVLDKIRQEFKNQGKELSDDEFAQYMQKYEQDLAQFAKTIQEYYVSLLFMTELADMFSELTKDMHTWFKFDSDAESEEESKETVYDQDKVVSKIDSSYALKKAIKKYPEQQAQIIDALGDKVVTFYEPFLYHKLLKLLNDEQKERLIPKLKLSEVEDYNYKELLNLLNEKQQLVVLKRLKLDDLSFHLLPEIVNQLNREGAEFVFSKLSQNKLKAFKSNYYMQEAATKLNHINFGLYLKTIGKERLKGNYNYPLDVLFDVDMPENNAHVYLFFFKQEIVAALAKNPEKISKLKLTNWQPLAKALFENIKTMKDIEASYKQCSHFPSHVRESAEILLVEKFKGFIFDAGQYIVLFNMAPQGKFQQGIKQKLESLNAAQVQALASGLTYQQFVALNKQCPQFELQLAEHTQYFQNSVKTVKDFVKFMSQCQNKPVVIAKLDINALMTSKANVLKVFQTLKTDQEKQAVLDNWGANKLFAVVTNLSDLNKLEPHLPQAFKQQEAYCLAKYKMFRASKKFQFFRSTELPEDATLQQVVQRAKEKDTGARRALVELGWMDKQGELKTDAPSCMK